MAVAHPLNGAYILRLLVNVVLILGCLRTGASADEPLDAGVADAPPDPDANNVDSDPHRATDPPAQPQVPLPTDGKKKHKADKAKGDDPKSKKKKKKKKLEFGGRVFVRSALTKGGAAPDPVAQNTLNSARVKTEYRSHGVRAEIEAEIAGKPRIKTAYGQLRLHDSGPKLDVRAGNFKMPFSAIQLASIWTLPMADRGLLDNVLGKRLQLTGRAVGVMMILELPGDWHPELDVGVFQGTDDVGNALAAPAQDRFGQDGVVRLAAKPTHGISIGMAGSVRSGELLAAPIVVRQGYAGEIDATIDVDTHPGRLRTWVEAMIGTSWLVGGMIPSHTLTRFHELRGIVSWRLGGTGHRDRYVELYGLAGQLDPDRIVTGDRVVELTGGISYGASEVWRVQAEAEVWRIGANAPLGIAEFAVAPSNTTTFLVQLGVRI